ncbi:MAG: AI-2E family transporter [Planctomycetaceae bacterium]
MFRIVSLAVVLTLIVVLGITFFKVVAPFLMPLFLAGVAAILGQPLFLYFVRRFGGRLRLASGVATGTIVFAIMTPLVVGTAIASMQLYVFAKDADRWDALLNQRGSEAGERIDAVAQSAADLLNGFRGMAEGDTGPSDPAPQPIQDDVLPSLIIEPMDATGDSLEVGDSGEMIAVNGSLLRDEAAITIREGKAFTADQIKTLVRSKAQALLVDLGDRSLGIFTGVLFTIISAVVSLLIFTVSLYYFFADGTELTVASQKLIPVHVNYQREMLNEFARAVRSVVSATFLAALGQSVATLAALWICGFDHLLTLFVLCLLSAMIPALGTWLVWGPCALILLLGREPHPVMATMLALYGAIVVGLLDNVIRTYVLNSDIKLHPLLALISVLGGLQVMGLWGVFIGPIIASCLYALMRIFNHELIALSRSRFGAHAAAAASEFLDAADGAQSPAFDTTTPSESPMAADQSVADPSAAELTPAPGPAASPKPASAEASNAARRKGKRK